MYLYSLLYYFVPSTHGRPLVTTLPNVVHSSLSLVAVSRFCKLRSVMFHILYFIELTLPWTTSSSAPITHPEHDQLHQAISSQNMTEVEHLSFVILV